MCLIKENVCSDFFRRFYHGAVNGTRTSVYCKDFETHSFQEIHRLFVLQFPPKDSSGKSNLLENGERIPQPWHQFKPQSAIQVTQGENVLRRASMRS